MLVQGKNVVFGKNVKIGDYVKIYDNVTIGDNVDIGDFCVIGYPSKNAKANLIIPENSVIRSHTIIYQGCIFKSKLETGHHVLIRENTIAGDNLRVGSYSDIEGDCEIGNYVRLHSYVHVGKGSKIGNFVWIYSLTTLTNDPLPPSNIFAPVTIEDGVVVCVNSTILPGVKLEKGAFVPANSVVNRNLKIGEVFSDGSSDLTVDMLVNLKNKVKHPWMNHFANNYPESCQNEILILKNEIIQSIKKRKG